MNIGSWWKSKKGKGACGVDFVVFYADWEKPWLPK